MTMENAEMREERTYSGRYASQIARLRLLLRTLAIVLPIALFGAAILVGLVFWVTLIPVLGTILVALVVAALIFSIPAAFFLIER